MGVGALANEDCHRTCDELSAKGVTFLSPPTERPYGIAATMRDDSGNMITLTQPFEMPSDVVTTSAGRRW